MENIHYYIRNFLFQKDNNLADSIKEMLKKVWQYILDKIGKSPFKYIVLLTILLSFYIFDDFWTNWMNKLWVNPIASQIGKSAWLVTIVYITIISLYYTYEFKKAESINKSRLKAILIFLCLYFLCFFSGKWEYLLIFENYNFSAWSNLLVLAIFIGEFIIIFHISRRNSTKENNPPLERERTIEIVDSYGRTPICKSTYQTLSSCFFKEGSFTVAIIGAWGSGKTTFMNKLKDYYIQDRAVGSVIEFEAWKCDSSDSITKNFFSILRDELKNYIPNISSVFNEYIELLVDDESVKRPLKFLGKSMQYVFDGNKSLYDQIKDKLKETKHKAIIFIDDLDRLNADEIKEILRIIRNTANFPFLQFIVTYDKNYVCERLRENGIINPQFYLEKFFNVETNLPKFKSRIICEEFMNRFKHTINEIWGLELDDIKIHHIVFNRLDSESNDIIDCNILLTQVLHTMRDVIRFHNAFYLVAKTYKDQKIENEIDFCDLFYLELLKYHHTDVYSLLYNHPLSILSIKGDTYALEENYINDIKTEIKSLEKKEVKSILQSLVSGEKFSDNVLIIKHQ